MKRILSLILSITLLFTLSFQTITAFASNTPVIVCDNVECEAGEQITVNVSISNNPGFTYLEMTPIYSSELTFVKVTNGELISDFTKGKQYVWAADEDVTTDGLLMSFTFDVAETVASGSYSVDFIVRTCGNFNEEPVDFTVQNGKVTVKAKPVAATGVSLNKETLSLNTGESETLIATVSPDNATNKTVSWKSSDTTIATVDNNGKVTAVKKGIATITATTEDGGYTASCVVTGNCSHRICHDVPAEDSTCIKQGHVAYTVCDECGEIIEGSDAKLPLGTHSYAEIVKADYLKSVATCNSKAVYYKSCSVCGEKSNDTFEHGEFDSNNHVGGTYVRDQKEATCYEEGYTGDTYCRDCNTKIASGTAIEKSAHNPASVWSTDADYHWKDCQTVGCGNIIDKAAHSGGEAACTKKAICSVCSVEYGSVNADNHKNTELRNVKAATEDEAGYTGDLFCKDCQKVIETGTVIPKLDHTHSMTAVSAKAATCTAEGNIAYWHCTKCDKYYSDSEGKTEISLSDTVIAKLDHSCTVLQHDDEKHWYKCENCDAVTAAEAHTGGNATCVNKAVCSVCGVEYGALSAHVYMEKADAQYLKSVATCNSKAVYYKSCSVCSEKSTDTFEYGEIDSNNHVGDTYVKDQKEATCYEEGYTGDIYCGGCNTKIASGTVIAKNVHNPASVWSTDEDYHWKDCQTVGCGNIIDKAAHAGGEATCTKKAICSVCGVEYGAVSADNHKNTEVCNAMEATCTADGYSGDTYCKDCGTKIADGKTISAGHQLDKIEAKSATHEVDGNIEYFKCSVCNKLFKEADTVTEITLADTIVAKGEHSYSEDYKSDAENHWKECGCGNIIEKAAHTFGDWSVIKEATATQTGTKERACSVCGYKNQETIPAVGTPTVPDKPANPSDTTNSSDTPEKSPQTGDSSNLALWIALMLISASGVATMTVLNRKKRVK